MSSQYRVQRTKNAIVLTHGASATTATASVALNGILLESFITTAAAVDSTATTTVNIKDSDGNVVYTKGSLAVDTTTKELLTADTRVPLSGTQTIEVVFSAAQTTADRTTTVVLLIER